MNQSNPPSCSHISPCQVNTPVGSAALVFEQPFLKEVPVTFRLQFPHDVEFENNVLKLSGENMYMGEMEFEIRKTSQDLTGQYSGEILFVSCSNKDMRWRAELAFKSSDDSFIQTRWIFAGPQN